MGESAPAVVGSYEVVREIGRGGMGVVYLARDTRLGRDVAIKCLPDELADDADRLARFEREARTLATLSHPNIAAIHGLEETGGRRYLVLEHVPGETLDERLQRGAIPLDEAIPIARQIAEAAEAAHEKGVIHRDLKPANIKFVDHESIKVLDFGLAKAMQRESDVASATESPTVQVAATTTRPGMVLGTPGYLSPEQARGYDVDTRSDVFAFGCILFEMLTGRLAFPGATISDSIAAVLEREPDLEALPRDVPAGLRRLLSRCLVKDRRRRLQSIGDARVELAEALESGAWPAEPTGATPPRRRLLAAIPWAACAVLAIALAVAMLGRNDGPSSPGARFPLPTPSGSAINWRGTKDTWSKIGFSQLLAVSPDGRRMAVTVQDGARTRLHLKEADAFDWTEVPGTDGARGAFFSPDGEWIGYLVESTLWRVRPGSTARRICDVSSAAFDATWREDDTIVFSTDHGLWRVDADGGTPVQLTTVAIDDGERGHHQPHAVPDSELVVFTLTDESGQHAALLSLDALEPQVIRTNVTGARYSRTGHLVYARGGEVLAAPFDPAAPEEVGPEQTIAQEVHGTPGQGGAIVHLFATSQEGLLIYAPQAASPEPDELVWVDHEGNEESIVDGEGHWMHQRLSPDGSKILFNSLSSDGMLDVHLYDFESGQENRLTRDGHVYDAEWSPDGREICFNSLDSVGRSTHMIRAALGAEPRKIFAGQADKRPHLCAWWAAEDSKESTLVFFDRSSVKGIWLSKQRDGAWTAPAELMNSHLNEAWAQISPDGTLIAYVGFDEDGRDIYVQTYPQAGAPKRVSNEGGGEPRWADSRTLYFREAGRIYRATIETEPSLRVADVKVLEAITRVYDAAASGHQHYDLSIDRKRFLMVKHGRRFHPDTVHVMEGWHRSIESR